MAHPSAINHILWKATNKISTELKKYLEFCKTYWLKRITKWLTRVQHDTWMLITTAINDILRKNTNVNTNKKIKLTVKNSIMLTS